MITINMNGNPAKVIDYAKNVSIINGEIIVDGKPIEEYDNTNVVKIEINGNIENLETK